MLILDLLLISGLPLLQETWISPWIER